MEDVDSLDELGSFHSGKVIVTLKCSRWTLGPMYHALSMDTVEGLRESGNFRTLMTYLGCTFTFFLMCTGPCMGRDKKWSHAYITYKYK
jgi:hypothetical protein